MTRRRTLVDPIADYCDRFTRDVYARRKGWQSLVSVEELEQARARVDPERVADIEALVRAELAGDAPPAVRGMADKSATELRSMIRDRMEGEDALRDKDGTVNTKLLRQMEEAEQMMDFAEMVGEKVLKLAQAEIDELRTELARRAPVTLADSHRGTWKAAEPYSRGDVVMWDMATWLAMDDTTDEKPGKTATWRLVAGRGRDGRDRTR